MMKYYLPAEACVPTNSIKMQKKSAKVFSICLKQVTVSFELNQEKLSNIGVDDGLN